MQEYIKKILGWGNNTITLIISNNKIEDVIKIVKSLADCGLVLKGVTETVQNELKAQKGGFLSMLLGTWGVSLLGNILVGKGIKRAGEGVLRAGYGCSLNFSKNKKDQKNNKIDF